MPKKPKSTSESAYREQELESETAFRNSLLFRYVRVIQRQDDTILIEPKPGHRITLVHQVDAADRRLVRVLMSPIAPAGKRG